MIIAQFVFSSARSCVRFADASIYPQEAKIAGGARSGWTKPANGNVRAGFAARKRKFQFGEIFVAAATMKVSSSAAAESHVLRKQPANRSRFSHAAHRQNVSGVAHVRAIFAAGLVDALKCAAHNVFHARIHFVDRPEIALQILRPLEIADGDAAGIGENVGQHENAATRQHFVRVRSGRPVRCFSDNLRFNLFGVVQSDYWDPLESTCRHASLSIL